MRRVEVISACSLPADLLLSPRFVCGVLWYIQMRCRSRRFRARRRDGVELNFCDHGNACFGILLLVKSSGLWKKYFVHVFVLFL